MRRRGRIPAARSFRPHWPWPRACTPAANGCIRAVVLGYDVAARVNYALGPDALAAASRSTHSIGGTFGAGAAAGALLGLDDRQVRHLLSFCAQQASGVGCHVRDPEHVEKAFDFGGMPARNGVTAATMVAAGMTGVDDVFSGERNFFEAYAPDPDPERLSEELGQRFEILGTNIKKWPVGSPAQAALDALTALMETERIGPDEIESIEVHLPARSARTVDNVADAQSQRPASHGHALDRSGRSPSKPFTTRDECRIRQFWRCGERSRWCRARNWRMPFRGGKPSSRSRRATAAALSQRTVAVRGTADNPMTQAEVEAKAFDLIGSVLGARRAKAIVRRNAQHSRPFPMSRRCVDCGSHRPESARHEDRR